MSRKEKVRYEIDPHNRLIVAKSGRKSEISKYRYLLDGRFKIDRKNQLSYHIKKSQSSDVPQQMKFSGNWSLDENHNLVLTLNKWGNQIADDKLTIKGKILDVRSNELLFAVTTKTPDNRTQIYVLDLSGSWQADENNRLSFNIRKERGPYDALTLEGIWEVNKRNQLIYRYIKRSLKTKQKQTHTLIFKGHWDITDKVRLSYVLSGAKTYPITISGRWRIDRRQGLVFEARYRGGRLYAIILGADVELNKRNHLEVRLKNGIGKDLGIKLTLSRKMPKGSGEIFIKTLASKKELAIHAGSGIIW